MKSVKKSSRRKVSKKPANAKKSKKPVRRAARAKKRIGIFGGTFDPFHVGHLNSLKSTLSAFRLSEIRVVPAYLSPMRKPVQGATPGERLRMVELGLQGESEKLVIDKSEMQREGTSYTVETLRHLQEQLAPAELMLIVGSDQLDHFDQWRDFSEILTLADLIVTSRPGSELPASTQSLRPALRQLVKAFGKNSVTLKTGKKIHFLQLDDVDVSASEIRRRIRGEQNLEGLVTPAVADFIAEKDLYGTVARSIGDFSKFTAECGKFLEGKGAVNLQAFDLRTTEAPAEFTIVASGTSTRHTSALGESLIREIKTKYHILPQGVEGLGEGRWVAVDYGSLMIHIFYDFVRQEYRLEELWKDGVRI